MPYHQQGFPVSSTKIRAVQKGQLYPFLLDIDTFDRAGEDGDIPIIPLNGGSEWVGETPEGQWHKGWDANIDTFTATILGGTLRLTGVASVAGTGGNGWINDHHVAPLLDELEYTVSLEVPVDDTGVTAARDIKLAHFIKQDKDELLPDNDNNFIQIEVDVDENGLIMYVRKEVNGVNTTLASGYDYTMDTTRSTGNLEATIWRVVFNGKPGTTGATISVYLKQSDTLANAELATENQLTGSPFSVSDLAFNVGYPSYRIYTENATYFGTSYDSANRAASTYLSVDYPDNFRLTYDFTESDYGKGEVELYDGDPDTTGVRVYDEDHVFNSTAYLQNGLIQTKLGSGTLFDFLVWNGASWEDFVVNILFRLQTSAITCNSIHIKSIEYISQEKIIINVRIQDTTTNDSDYYVDCQFIMTRGIPSLELKLLKNHPSQTMYYRSWFDFPYGYVGDNEIGVLGISTGTNTTLTDNFETRVSVTREVIVGTSSNKKPLDSPSDYKSQSGSLFFYEDMTATQIASTRLFLHGVVFSDAANVFIEAEDATVAGGATVVGTEVLMDAQNETNYYDVTAGTDLPAGRYLAVFRLKDTNQVAGDAGIRVYNTTDSEYRNEEGTYVNETVTAAYAHYSIFFDITDTDVSGGDTIRIQVNKQTANANDLNSDYFLIFPIGNGMNWIQDLSHGALRNIRGYRKLCIR